MLLSIFVSWAILTIMVRSENITACYYSRYVYYYLSTTKSVLLYEFTGVSRREFTIAEFKAYEGDLQTLGEIVLMMLNDLQANNPTSQPKDLMAVNLVLNNISGSLSSSMIINTSHTRKIDMLINIINKLLISILNIVPINCPKSVNTFDNAWIRRDARPPSTDYNELNDMLPKKLYTNITEENVNSVMYELGGSALSMKYIMGKKPKTENEHFRPRKAFFYDLLSGDQSRSNGVDRLELLRDVRIITPLSDGKIATITELLEMAKLFVINAQCLGSFQRQVLAATAHPVLTVIARYLLILKQIYYTKEKQNEHANGRIELFGVEIGNIGDKVNKSLKDFIALDIYPVKIKQHFEITHSLLDERIKSLDKKMTQISTPKWIGQIFSRCLYPMTVNNLEFIELDNPENPKTELTVLNRIAELKDDINKVESYINILNKKKKHYGITKSKNVLFSHEYMFEEDLACDIIENYRINYFKLKKKF